MENFKMARGTIKWFNEKKGYGFIQRENGESDVFIHYSNIKSDSLKILMEGQSVEFEVMQDAKGAKAVNLIPVSSSTDQRS